MLVTIVARIGGKAVNLVVFLVLARTLTVDDLGLFGFVFTTVLVMISAFDVGVRNSVAYFIGRTPDKLPTLALQTLLLWGGLSVLGLVTLYSVLYVAGNGLHQPVYAIPAGTLFVSMLFLRMGQGVLLGQGRITFYNQTELVSRVVLASAVGLLLLMDRVTLGSALAAMGGSYGVGAIVLAAGIVPVTRHGDRLDIEAAKLLLRRGFVFMTAVLLMTATNRIAFLLLSQLGQADEVGLFYGLQRLTEVLTEIALAVALVGFSQSVRAESSESAVRDAAQSTRMSFAVFGSMALVAFIGADLLPPLALGESFRGTGSLFRIVLVGTLCGSVWAMLFPSLSAIASPGLCVRIFVPNVTLSVVACWMGYAHYGLTGLAVGFAVTHLLLAVSFLMVFRVKYSTPIRAFLVPRPSEFIEPVGALLKMLGSMKQRRGRTP